jgi:AsmA protein
MNFVLTTPAAIRDGKTANLKFDLTLATSKIGGDLEIAEGEDFSYAGPVSLSAPDLAALASIFGIDLSDTAGFDRLEARGEAKGDANHISLSGAAIEFDKIKGTGDVQLAWNGARPKASGALDVGVLDLRPYMPPPPADSDGFPAWSSQNIDFSSLKNIDAQFDVQAEKIFLNNMETGEARLDLTVAAGRLTAEMPQLSLYGGGGSGRIVIDASRKTPAISGAFDFGAVNAETFSKDVLSTDRLLGLGGVRVQFTAAGASQKAIMSSLNGKGGFDLADGAVKGVNIVKIAQAVAKLGEGGIVNPAAITAAIAEARRPSEQTDYSKFLSQFSMTNGVLNAPTISLEGPYLTMNGQGVIDLANQTVDLRLAPRATTSADGVEGRYLTVPMRIAGTFSEPKISVDVESLLRDRVDSIGRGVLQGVLGGGSGRGEEEPDAPSTQEEAAKSLLEGVFGGSKRDAPAEDDDSTQSTETNAETTSVENIARDALGGLFGKNKGATREQDEAQSAEEASPE